MLVGGAGVGLVIPAITAAAAAALPPERFATGTAVVATPLPLAFSISEIFRMRIEDIFQKD